MKKIKERKFQVPHTYVIIGTILLIVTIMTYIIPAGQYDRYEDENGNLVVDGNSFEFIEQTPVGPFEMIKSIGDGMVQAADIIFFIFFAYGMVYMMIKSGAFYGGVGVLIRRLRGREVLIFPVFMIIFGICGSTFGLYEEAYGLIPAFVGIAIALGYDGLVGGAAVVLGTVTGFAAATLNPFTIGIAQGIAGLPIGSGIGFRIICFIIFEAIVIWYLMRYANRVKRDPANSIVQNVQFNVKDGMSREEVESLEFNSRHKLIILAFVATIGVLIFGTSQYGWYLSELSTLFLISMVIIGLIAKFKLSEICDYFVEAVRDVMFGALVVGIARSLTIVMTEGNIIDTMVYYATTVLQDVPASVAAIGMLISQNFINFFIPSGSGQAAVSMPLMLPLADTLGISRQVTVLAFQFGDGFSNMFWPTVVATECGLMGLPVQKWYKFMLPLFGIIFATQVILITVATLIGY